MRENRRFFMVLTGWAGFALFFAVWLAFHWGGTTVTQRFDNITETLAAFAAAAACSAAALRNRQRTRIAWALIGASALSWGLGQTVWSYFELVRGIQVPFPSLADIGYLSAVPLAVARLLFLPSAPARATYLLRTILDGVLLPSLPSTISRATFRGTGYPP